jgi:hypothetical protein
MDIRKLLEAGHAALAADKAESEKSKAGHPRVGSAGIVVGDEVFGTCHRKTLARSLGIEGKPELYTDIMWKAGEANEWHWERILGKAGANITKPDQSAVRRQIEGVPLDLLGTPDVVLVDDGSTAGRFGLELKGIFGYSTAALVYFECTPKNDNLIQAATYSWALGLPWALCYTSSTYMPVNFYDQKKYGGIKSIKPFYRIFYMEWRDETLWYRDETQQDWVRTNITPKAIQDYYRLIEVMKAGQDLGPRVTTNYVNGKDDKWGPHGACGLCELARACDKYELDYDYAGWVQHIKTICAKE